MVARGRTLLHLARHAQTSFGPAGRGWVTSTATCTELRPRPDRRQSRRLGEVPACGAGPSARLQRHPRRGRGLSNPPAARVRLAEAGKSGRIARCPGVHSPLSTVGKSVWGGRPIMRKASFLLLAVALASLPQVKADDEKPKRSDAELKAIARLKEAGGLAMEVAQSDPRLEVSLQLASGPITDATLKPLADMNDVVSLNLRGTDVTDAGMVTVGKMNSLVRLHLERTKITDAGLAHLKGLANLEWRDIYDSPVTDAGLAQLDGLKKLKRLYIMGTKVTQGGINKLKRAVSGIQVTPDYELETRRVALEYHRALDDARNSVAESRKGVQESERQIAATQKAAEAPLAAAVAAQSQFDQDAK